MKKEYWQRQEYFRCTNCGEVYEDKLPKDGKCKNGCKMNEYAIYDRHPNEREEAMLDWWSRFGGAEPNRIGVAFPKGHSLAGMLQPSGSSSFISGSMGIFNKPSLVDGAELGEYRL